MFKSTTIIGQGAQLLPANAADQIRGLVNGFATNDPDQIVQISAQKLIPLIDDGVITPFDPSKVFLQYYCENWWRAWNEGSVGGWVFWQVNGTNEAGMLMLSPGDTMYYKVQNAGLMRLYFQSTQIRSATHQNAPCVYGN